MSVMTLQNLVEMSIERLNKFWTVRRLTKRLIWHQRYIKMDNKAIDALHANILHHDKERINLRLQLMDLGVDPDVVAPEEEVKS